MTVTKLVKLRKVGRSIYMSHTDKLKVNGLRVHGIIFPHFSKHILRIVSDIRELQRVTLHYQNQ